MRAISLHQPWASLVAFGEKEIETRHWSTDYRGRIAIHATARMTHEGREFCETSPWWLDVKNRHGSEIWQDLPLPFGCIVCIVNLWQVMPTEKVRDVITPREEDFGDYAAGRFAWFLRLETVFHKPIPAKGHQKWWDWKEPRR